MQRLDVLALQLGVEQRHAEALLDEDHQLYERDRVDPDLVEWPIGRELGGRLVQHDGQLLAQRVLDVLDAHGSPLPSAASSTKAPSPAQFSFRHATRRGPKAAGFVPGARSGAVSMRPLRTKDAQAVADGMCPA